MAARRDDSMLFSLQGLSPADRQRVERELRQHRLAAAAAAARAESKRQADLERGRLAGEEAERQGEAELQARAAIERARAEFESRAKVELLELQHAHERRMRALESRGQRGNQVAALGLVVAMVCVVGSLGFYLGKVRPETARVQRAYDTLVAAERHRAEETKRMLEKSERRRAELATELQVARRRIDAREGGSK